MKTLLKQLGILKFLAIKNQYNQCIDKNDFYDMLKRRLKFKKASELASFLNYEFEIHFKEYSQYQ